MGSSRDTTAISEDGILSHEQLALFLGISLDELEDFETNGVDLTDPNTNRDFICSDGDRGVIHQWISPTGYEEWPDLDF